MPSYLTYLAVTEMNADRIRAAENHRLAADAAAAKGPRRTREITVPSVRQSRILFFRKRAKLA